MSNTTQHQDIEDIADKINWETQYKAVHEALDQLFAKQDQVEEFDFAAAVYALMGECVTILGDFGFERATLLEEVVANYPEHQCDCEVCEAEDSQEEAQLSADAAPQGTLLN